MAGFNPPATTNIAIQVRVMVCSPYPKKPSLNGSALDIALD
jgi:hypothetical protein